MLDILKDILSKYLQEDPYPAIDDRVPCPECGRQMLYRDVWEHFFITHLNLREKLSDTNGHSDSSASSDRNKVRKRDLLDSYELERPEEDIGPEQDLQLQDPTGSSNSVNREQLKNKWRPFIQELRREEELKVSTDEHFRGLRGHHIAQRFKQVAYRLEIEVEVEMKDRCAIIQKV